MSRIGKKVISLSENIQADIKNSIVKIKGEKGELHYKLSEAIKIEYTNKQIHLYRKKESKKAKELHGLSRTIINNMVIGVSKGFNKKLEVQGIGYRCQMDGTNLVLNLGYSHSIIITPPKDIVIQIENNTNIIISGINKETVGQVAAKIRKTRPIEPYKGKGIRYSGEVVRRKVGKAGK
uniref:ribosomal protein L6 n=1 Tax=Catenella fusiformis TaxID=3024791 RepID=UPI0027D9DF4E|nr:ribosomal protein L6 [Catenella fusiformis]WCH57574.1 ribosomal protein L6 [Catenella fusiformis]